MLTRTLLLLLLTLTTATFAQQPNITNAQLHTVPGGNLQQAIAAVHDTAWVGYSELAIHAFHNDWDNDTNYLEGHPKTDPVKEAKANDPANIYILLRVLGGRVVKVSLSDPDRAIDAGGLPVTWLTEVPQSTSLHVLNTIAEQNITAAPTQPDHTRYAPTQPAPRNVADAALLAIAQHHAPEATGTLQHFTASAYPEWAREKAAFWLAQARGADGFNAVKALLHSEHEEEFRNKLTFDLTLVKGTSQQAATEELITVARNDTSPKVRSQAQFWLAQQINRGHTTDARAAETLRDQAASDPNAAIRKSAVFALSRLPQDQAATELIHIASTTSDPTTKHEAVFWLSRNKDPRSLDYLEKLAKQ